MPKNAKKIIITGWLGYIGSHTAVVFQQAGYEVVIIDNCSNAKIDVLDKIEQITWIKPAYHNADIRVIWELEKVLREHQDAAGVIHFAGKKAVGESCEFPFRYYSNNVKGSIHLLQTMDKYGIKNIVFSSSSTVYDTEKNMPPYVETDQLRTINPYGNTKLMIERILSDLAQYRYFRCISLRYFNPIGAHHTGLIWENPKGTPSNLLPYIFKVLSGEFGKVKVFGKDYTTKDGTWVRDYIHVMDVAEAHLNAYEKMYDLETQKDGWFHEIFNIGTGEWTSVLELIELVEKVTDKNVYYDIVDRRPWDCAVSIANPSKAEKILGRKANRTMRQAIQDWRNFVSKKPE